MYFGDFDLEAHVIALGQSVGDVGVGFADSQSCKSLSTSWVRAANQPQCIATSAR